MEPVSAEPGVKKQDIRPLSKLGVVFTSFLSHLRGGPIQWLHVSPEAPSVLLKQHFY